jgi:phospholipase C
VNYFRRLLAIVVLGSAVTVCAGSVASAHVEKLGRDSTQTTTPIQHLVVIYQENVSFDHYFGTYPIATNPADEPAFHAAPDTPTVNGLTSELLTNNPNAANPKRLDTRVRSQAVTCDQDHAYTDEQGAYDKGLVDKFVQSVAGRSGSCKNKPIVMDYFDGNTVTALWNYAQNFALNDNSFGTTFGQSTVGALNLISGQTHGAVATPSGANDAAIANGTIYHDEDPTYDDCSAQATTKDPTVAMTGKNIGDLLNAKGVTWGWFEGGFAPSSVNNGKAVCATSHTNVAGKPVLDYIPHHEPFQYYQSTANPHHLPPSAISMIGQTDQANHQYDISYFFEALANGNMPAVSFLKAPGYEDGHAGYSDPLDEQTFLVDTINRIEQSPDWTSTAIVIAYDDSDGWYDHVMPPIVNQSNSAQDALTGTGSCGTAKAGAYQDRCGYGPRLPQLVISSYARQNFVDNTLTDQTSILRFIEDNWSTGSIGDQSFDALAGPLNNMFDFSHGGRANKLFLNPTTGEPVR